MGDHILRQYINLSYLREYIFNFIIRVYGFIRNEVRDARIQVEYQKTFEEGPLVKSKLKDKLNEFFSLMIPLINEGSYNRFNSLDYLSKSSKIHQVIGIIEQLRGFYDLTPNERNQFKKLINTVSNNFPSLERTVKFLDKMVTGRCLSDKAVFILVRNFIASEWIHRNIKGPDTKIKTKDLNYLNYTIEEYQVYLHNCLNFLIRDTKKFISRYPEEYKRNPDLDVEILQSLKWSVYNDFKFSVPGSNKVLDQVDSFNGLDLFNLIEKEAKPIKIKGWYKEKPKSDYIDSGVYKAYRSTQGSKSTLQNLQKTIKPFGLKNA